MKIIRDNKNSSVILSNNNGFTMVEMLLSLVLFIVITSLVVELFAIYKSNMMQSNQMHRKEWEVFSLQLQKEIRNSMDQQVVPQKIHLTTNNGLVSIEVYQNSVRRTVNGAGHEVMLQNVAHYDVQKEGDYIIVQVTDIGGKVYRRIFQPMVTRDSLHE